MSQSPKRLSNWLADMANPTSLPAVVSNIPPDLRIYTDRLREYLARQEQRILTLEQAVGVTSGSGSTTATVHGRPGGTTPPATGLPCGQAVTPTAPSNFTVQAGFSGFTLMWDVPTYCGHGYTEIFGATSNDVAAATCNNAGPMSPCRGRLGISGGRTFSFVADPGAYWCFWIRHVNVNGQPGPMNATGGICARTALDPGYLLNLLTGKITESQLFADLSQRIQLIDVAARVAVTLDDRLQSLADASKRDLNLVQNGYVDLIIQGENSNTTVRALNTTVQGLDSELSAAADALELLTTEVTSQDGELTAVATKLTTLTAEVANSNASMAQLWSAMATDDAAQASRIDSLESEVTDLDSGLSATAGALDALTTDVSVIDGEVSAVAGRVTTLESTVNDPATGLSATAGALDALTTDVELQDGELTAVAARLTSLTAEVASSTASMAQLWSASATDNAATASLVTQVAASIGGDTAAIEEVWGAEASESGLFAQQYLKIDVAGHVSGYGLSTDAPVDANPSSAFGVRADQFWVAPPTIHQATAPVTNLYNGKAWTASGAVTVDGVAYPADTTFYYFSGGKLWAEGDSGQSYSAGWKVDRKFAVVPFQILTSSVTINGVTLTPGVYLSTAFIGAATIGWAKIADSLEVGELVKSSSYTAGATGWQIKGDGTAEFTDVTIRSSAAGRGNLYGGGATAWATGTGLFAGWDASTYKWRVGNPSGARVQWDGSGFAIYDTKNAMVMASGIGVGAGNLVPNSGFSGLTGGSMPPFSSLAPWVLSSSYYSIAYTGLGTATLDVHPYWLPRPPGFTALFANRWGSSVDVGAYFTHTQFIPVNSGMWHDVSGYCASTYCTRKLYVTWFSGTQASPTYLSHTEIGTFANTNPTTDLKDWPYVAGFAQAPANATLARVVVSMGSRLNTGNADNYVYVGRLFFSQVSTDQYNAGTHTAWSESVPGKITDSSVSTYIANAAIDSAKIKDLSADKLTAGTLQVATYLKSSDFNGTINSGTGGITNPGTTGFAITGKGDAVFDTVHIRKNAVTVMDFGDETSQLTLNPSNSADNTVSCSLSVRADASGVLGFVDFCALVNGPGATIKAEVKRWVGVQANVTIKSIQFSTVSGAKLVYSFSFLDKLPVTGAATYRLALTHMNDSIGIISVYERSICLTGANR